MAKIKSEAAYRAALIRIDALLPLVNDNTPTDDPNYLELDMISDMVEEYENVYYPIGKPSLVDVMKLSDDEEFFNFLKSMPVNPISAEEQIKAIEENRKRQQIRNWDMGEE